MSEIGLVPGIGIAGTGLTAERARLDAISANIANAGTTRTETGQPYRRQLVELTAPADVELPAPPLAAPATRTPLARTHPQHQPGGDEPVLERSRRGGVAVSGVVEDPSPFPVVHDPGHPDADARGFVRMPNVDMVHEMVDLMMASRAYEANLRSLEAAREMVGRTLDALAT